VSRKRGKKTNRSSENDMRVLESLIGGREVGEGDEAETSRASGAVVYWDCGVQNGAVLGEVNF